MYLQGITKSARLNAVQSRHAVIFSQFETIYLLKMILSGFFWFFVLKSKSGLNDQNLMCFFFFLRWIVIYNDDLFKYCTVHT